ncbi:MAG: Dabb family protein [Chloroflexi bacterium]|nr:Dabb family protein [Chloroflexota bacterium]
MYQRIVCFKFKAGTSPEVVQAHMADFRQLQDAMPYIVSYSGGLAISGDQGAPPGYDSLHYLTFSTLDDIDRYFAHDAHQRFITAHKDIWADVLVLNAEIDTV